MGTFSVKKIVILGKNEVIILFGTFRSSSMVGGRVDK